MSSEANADITPEIAGAPNPESSSSFATIAAPPDNSRMVWAPRIDLRPSRRQLLGGLVASGIAATLMSPAAQPAPSLEQFITELKNLRRDALATLRTLLDRNQLARADGYIYSIDAAQLLICFARAGDRDACQRLRDHCVHHLIGDSLSDPFTRGFVAWRYKPGVSPDATGTTESLRVARGLWIGARVFGNRADAQLTGVVLAGYAQHATTDQGVWLIRNYFSFPTRSFASNSFLVDYDPDLIREVADATREPALSALADQCVSRVRQSVSPCGLLYDLVQPELKTLYPLLNVYAYSPNDVIGLSNSVTVGICVARTAPDVARGILNFGVSRLDDLRRYYLGRTGLPADPAPAALFEHSTLTRLAILLHEPSVAASILTRALPLWHRLVGTAGRRELFILTEIVQTIDDLLV